MNNDNVLYAYMSSLLLEGRLPYTGSWDQNFPGVLLVHLPQILVLGRSDLAFHIWDMALQLVSCWLLYRIGRRLGGDMAGSLATILAALFYVQQGLWTAGQRDTYVTLLMLAATDRLLIAEVLRRQSYLIGLLLGLALLIRPTYGLYLLGPMVILGGVMREQLRYILGSVTPWAATIVLYALAGGLGEFYLATIRFNSDIYIGQGAEFGLWEPVRYYAVSLVAAVAGFIWLARAGAYRVLALWSIFFISSVVSLVLLYRHSAYHYHPAMIMLILMSAIGWAKMIQLASERVRGVTIQRTITAAGALLIVGFFSFQTFRGNTIQHLLRDLAVGKIGSLQQMYSYYEGSSEFGYVPQLRLSEYLQRTCTEGEAVQMFGPYSYAQYRAGLSSASRFQTLHGLVMRREGTALQPYQIRWRDEYLYSLDSVRPKIFIVSDGPEAFRQYYGGRLGHEILNEDWTELNAWLHKHYSQDTVIGTFTAYRLIAPRSS